MTKDNADYGLYVHYVRSAIPKCHGYQELHAHSEASFRDAVNKVDDFVETAKGYGRQAFAITDHGNQMRLYQGIKARTKDEKKNLEAVLQEANVPEDEIHKILKSIGDTDSIRYPTDKMWPYVKKYCKLFLKAAEKSIQFVPGMEAYFQPEKVEGNRDSFHLILYAKDWNGQKTLFKLENLAQLNKSPKGKWNGQETGGLPRMTWADLERFVGPGTEGHGHLIATSACVGGYIPYLILRPWYIADKQHAISMALAKLGNAYTEEDVKQAEQDLVDAKEKATKAKSFGRSALTKRFHKASCLLLLPAVILCAGNFLDVLPDIVGNFQIGSKSTDRMASPSTAVAVDAVTKLDAATSIFFPVMQVDRVVVQQNTGRIDSGFADSFCCSFRFADAARNKDTVCLGNSRKIGVQPFVFFVNGIRILRHICRKNMNINFRISAV